MKSFQKIIYEKNNYEQIRDNDLNKENDQNNPIKISVL